MIKQIVRAIHCTAQIGFSVWYGIHTANLLHGFFFFCVWDTSVNLLILALTLFIAALDL